MRNSVAEQFSTGLHYLYGAHQQGAKQAAANRGTSTSPKLLQMLRTGTQQNEKQAQRLEQVFRASGLKPKARHDRAMQGIMDANNAATAQTRDPVQRDLANIAFGQVAAHLYLANYGTLRTYAEVLGNTRAADLLQQTLDETKTIDLEFTRLAQRLISRSDARDYSGESASYTTAAMHPAITGLLLTGLIAAAGAMLAGSGTARSGGQRNR